MTLQLLAVHSRLIPILQVLSPSSVANGGGNAAKKETVLAAQTGLDGNGQANPAADGSSPTGEVGKACKQCKAWKLLSDFHKNSNGYRGTCKTCISSVRRANKLRRQSEMVTSIQHFLKAIKFFFVAGTIKSKSKQMSFSSMSPRYSSLACKAFEDLYRDTK